MACLVGESRLDHQEEGALVPEHQLKGFIHHILEPKGAIPVGIIGKDIGKEGSQHRLFKCMTRPHMGDEIIPAREGEDGAIPEFHLGLANHLKIVTSVTLSTTHVMKPLVSSTQNDVGADSHLRNDLRGDE